MKKITKGIKGHRSDQQPSIRLLLGNRRSQGSKMRVAEGRWPTEILLGDPIRSGRATGEKGQRKSYEKHVKNTTQFSKERSQVKE